MKCLNERFVLFSIKYVSFCTIRNYSKRFEKKSFTRWFIWKTLILFFSTIWYRMKSEMIESLNYSIYIHSKRCVFRKWNTSKKLTNKKSKNIYSITKFRINIVFENLLNVKSLKLLIWCLTSISSLKSKKKNENYSIFDFSFLIDQTNQNFLDNQCTIANIANSNDLNSNFAKSNVEKHNFDNFDDYQNSIESISSI